MTLLKEKLGTVKGKLYLIIWLVFWTVTAVYYFSNTEVMLKYQGIRPTWVYILYFGMIALLAFSVWFCFRRWLKTDAEKKKAVNKMRWYHYLALVLNACYCFLLMEMINNSEKLLEMKPLYMLMNIIGTLIMTLIVLLLFNHFKRAMLFILVFTTVMALIFYFVYLCRGEPFQLIDVFSFSTAMDVAGGYEFTMTRWIVTFVTASMCLIGIYMHFNIFVMVKGLKSKILIRLIAVGIIIGGYFAAFNLSWNGALDIVTDLWAPHKTYQEVGTNMGFFCVAKYMKNEPPQGYTVEGTREIAEQSVEDYKVWDGKEEVTPGSEVPVNIIAIMNEAWADYEYAGEFETTSEIQPFYNSLEENTVKGHTMVCISGGGTAKTEYEFLTGNSVKQYPGMVPYVSYFTHDQYTLASTLEAQGYETIAMHPNKATNWNRDKAYRLMGFDEFISIDDFEDADTLRGMVTDQANYEKIIETVENKENPDDPLFLFDVTMQNHGGYKAHFTGDDKVQVKGYEDEEGQVARYLSLVNLSDQALEYLINYFEDCDQPTMILMFGDHYPDLPQEFEEFIAGAKRDELPVEEMEKFYSTPFFIWTNYEMEEEDDILTSTNFLGLLMMEKTGLEVPDYLHYEEMFQDDIYAYNHKGYINSEGEIKEWADFTDEEDHKLWEYECLQYNNLIENGNRLDWFFTVGGKENDSGQ